ncbi:hypothetical protein [Lusitaniella coriacea]|uniref:hypothetical protein n=1 Tax=Lusitaniella coriacea TaxID=1983105 RepID=UPI003CF352C9
MSLLTESLEKISDWLRVNNPESIADLRPGLGDSKIDRLIQNLPFILPREIREVYRSSNGYLELEPNVFLHPLERAIELADCNWMRGEKISSSSHILPLLQGNGKDFYYIICDRENDSSVWCVFVGEEPVMYTASLTSLILTSWECYETGAYYMCFDEKAGDYYVEKDLEKFKKIFQRYNPEQMDTWRYLYED